LTEKFTPELQQIFNELGFANVLVKYRAAANHDQDPLVIEIYYPKLTEKDIYLYDIEKISKTLYFEKALSNKDLYKAIVAHRDKFSHLGGVDYAKHEPQFINIIPPKNLLSLWEKDYAEMSGSMIYGEKLNFNELIGNIRQVNEKINRIEW
jgi:hypothetical protein